MAKTHYQTNDEASAICSSHLILTRPLEPTTTNGDCPQSIRQLRGAMIVNRPLVGQIGEHSFRTNAWAIPLPDASIEQVTCLDVLEYVRGDDTLVAECARVLQSGGLLTIRVPNAGLLEGLDPLNLYHYVVDISGKRPRPIETDELGWRRHYSVEAMTKMLLPQFDIESIETRRIGLSALAQTTSLLIGRWLFGSRAIERRASDLARRIEQWEDQIVLKDNGWSLTAMARRRDET